MMEEYFDYKKEKQVHVMGTCNFKELNFIGLFIIFSLYSIKSLCLEYSNIDKKKIDSSITWFQIFHWPWLFNRQ